MSILYPPPLVLTSVFGHKIAQGVKKCKYMKKEQLFI